MKDDSGIDSFKSNANCIYVDKNIIQYDVVTARLIQREEMCRMENGQPPDWNRLDNAQRTMHHALHHQPGERGAMTIRPDSIVRRKE